MAYLSFLRRAVLPLLVSSALVACTADSLIPPSSIDSSARVGSIKPHRSMPQRQFTYQGDQAPVNSASANYANSYNLSGSRQSAAPMPASAAAKQGRLPMAGANEAVTTTDVQEGLAQQSDVPSQGVNMDAELGVGPSEEAQSGPVVGLAQEEGQNIAEGETDQPVVDGIGSDTPVQANRSIIQRPAAQAELNQSPIRRKMPNTQVAMLPRVGNPMPRIEQQEEAPQSSPGGAMPTSEIACRQELQRMGVVYNDKPPINDGPACQVPYPVSLSGLSGNIAVRPAVTLNCQVTLAFAKWVKNELAPAARTRYWTGVGTIVPLGGYSCRRMNNSRQRYNPMSEHAHGNAIDVGTFVLKNGHVIDVRKKGLFSFREGRLLKAVRSDSCNYFDTVLGPGSNAEHWNHFHFDLRDRRGGRRYCSL
ncbi:MULTISPECIES: extensin family protein [unclassified Rhizobium]|uniref:extensin-like domain-containing protein n=1 Tax=unclassified Rhizobium TaxID=2613769 RepID=UPI000CDF3955|nr:MULTISPECIES: extensin family protein [Rhizobium]AVA21854.1 extensin-like protein [Rhizobium sp. NXC24]MDK4737780.1 extensin family protein [Rhizobium sp. CNPSo 3464]UWU22906.1 extensin family protein [Rhizobium tropici]